jgi:hypothetical protein
MAFGMGAERKSAWNSWPRSARRVSMARIRCPTEAPGVPTGVRGTSEAGRLTSTGSRMYDVK